MSVNPNLVPSFRFPNHISDAEVHPEVRKAIKSTFQALTDIYSAIPKLKAQIDAKTNTTTSVASVAGSAPNNPTGIPGNTPPVAHEWIDSFDSSSGMFHQSQPAFTDISGVATTAQIGTGTPAAGKYVDGAAGAWTALPVVPATLAAVTGKYVVSYNAGTGALSLSTATGISATIVTAALTVGGTQGSQTFVGGLLTAQTPAT